ncbi:hypothetical protein Bca4012_054178 [Brassica carinata]|uniref:Transmembrane protein n=1 Tax=Brassica carinata TaxID=52824 RepID=A0A8X7VZN0_BRACI|nr:hypothetical protein Bca52824_012788 [Brassica carinata]
MASSKIFLASSLLMALMFSSMIISSVAAKQLTKKKIPGFPTNPMPFPQFPKPGFPTNPMPFPQFPKPVFLSFRVLVSRPCFPFFPSDHTVWKPQAGSIHLRAALSTSKSHHQSLSVSIQTYSMIQLLW